MIKAVIFDLDGTLLNREASVIKFINAQYDRLYHFVGHIPKEHYVEKFIELDCRGYVWKDQVYAELVKEFHITGITWEALLEDYITHFKHACVPFPNLIGLLETLKKRNLSMGIITNGKSSFQMANIKALGIEDYFDAILISEREGLKKPDPKIFMCALERLKVTAEESAFVGDHPVNDVKAARNVGMTAIWKKDDFWKHVEADFIIEDLSELPTILGFY